MDVICSSRLPNQEDNLLTCKAYGMTEATHRSGIATYMPTSMCR